MKSYDVLLHTPIGKRKGEMKVKIENGKLIGFLSLFGNTEPIEGSVEDNGDCVLRGRFITLLKPVDFTAVGTIRQDDLHFILKGAYGTYKLMGSSQSGKEGAN